MARLNIERQNKLSPTRIEYTKQKLESVGFPIYTQSDIYLKFFYKGEIVTFYPYSGWHTGKSIKDGRGIEKLLKQLK